VKRYALPLAALLVLLAALVPLTRATEAAETPEPGPTCAEPRHPFLAVLEDFAAGYYAAPRVELPSLSSSVASHE